ncbi:MAG: hypothetical protein ACP5RT_00845 [Candidatus Micrarchaeia archaeon]
MEKARTANTNARNPRKNFRKDGEKVVADKANANDATTRMPNIIV